MQTTTYGEQSKDKSGTYVPPHRRQANSFVGVTMHRLTVAQLMEAPVIVVVAKPSDGMAPIFDALRAAEPNEFILNTKDCTNAPSVVRALNKQYSDHDALAAQIRSRNTLFLYTQSTVYANEFTSSIIFDNEGKNVIPLSESVKEIWRPDLSPSVFSALNHPELPLKKLRVGFLPYELEGEWGKSWNVTADVADYIIIPRITAFENIHKFPVLRLDMLIPLPDRSYVVLRGDAWKEEDVFWLYLE